MRTLAWTLSLFSLLSLLSLVSCRKKPDVPSHSGGAVISAAISPRNSSSPRIAWLSDFRPEVTYRRSQEMLWRQVRPGMAFFFDDAVQTQRSGLADLRFVHGSVLRMRPETLVIISPSDSGMRKLDRAVLRGGSLDGRTGKELWLLTSAALFRLRARSESRAARARISVHEGGSLRVRLDRGSGTLLRRTRTGQLIERRLRPNESLRLNAPVVGKNFGQKTDWKFWSGKPVVKSERRQRSRPAPSLDLTILEPENNLETPHSKVLVRGKVTLAGTRVFVNGMEIRLGTNLEFKRRVSLVPGTNTVVIQAVSASGNSKLRRLTIVRRR